jgi:ribokinase
MSRPRITVIGASNVDLISYVPHLPAMGETLHGHRFHIGFGGKGANQAVMAARLGADVAMVTKLGKDVFGENTLENFRASGIDTTHVTLTDAASTGVAPIAVDADGNNAIIIVTGANDLLTSEDLAWAGSTISSCRVMVCQMEIPVEVNLAALRMARAAGVTTIVNPAPARADFPDELFRLSDVFCPNESETELLTGLPVATPEQAELAARRLLQRGATSVVLTLGARGALIVSATEALLVPAVEVKATDTTGAGDAFVGSMAFFLAVGRPLVEAVRRANEIAAISVQSTGTQTSFPRAEDLPRGLLG